MHGFGISCALLHLGDSTLIWRIQRCVGGGVRPLALINKRANPTTQIEEFKRNSVGNLTEFLTTYAVLLTQGHKLVLSD